jgi:hypothetical protein
VGSSGPNDVDSRRTKTAAEATRRSRTAAKYNPKDKPGRARRNAEVRKRSKAPRLTRNKKIARDRLNPL